MFCYVFRDDDIKGPARVREILPFFIINLKRSNVVDTVKGGPDISFRRDIYIDIPSTVVQSIICIVHNNPCGWIPCQQFVPFFR